MNRYVTLAPSRHFFLAETDDEALDHFAGQQQAAPANPNVEHSRTTNGRICRAAVWRVEADGQCTPISAEAKTRAPLAITE